MSSSPIRLRVASAYADQRGARVAIVRRRDVLFDVGEIRPRMLEQRGRHDEPFVARAGQRVDDEDAQIRIARLAAIPEREPAVAVLHVREVLEIVGHARR